MADEPEGAAHEDYAMCFLGAGGRQTSLPGGPVDLADIALAKANIVDGSDPERLALRIAALRRTFEDAGMLLAGRPPPAFARAALRDVLRREGPAAFTAFLDDWGIGLQPDSLSPLLRFAPPGSPEESIYLCQAPDAEEPSFASAGGIPDADVHWIRPSAALRLHEQGRIELPLSQWYAMAFLHKHLRDLSGLPDLIASSACTALREAHLDAHALSGAHTPANGSLWLALPGDEAHPAQPGGLGARHRVFAEPSVVTGGGLRALALEGVLAPPTRGMSQGRGPAPSTTARL